MLDADTRLRVRERAENRCEYCRLPQSSARFLTFHIEHVEARKHITDDSLDNLALACPDCNRSKGPNLVTLVPGSRTLVPLFHPRRDRWADHFEFQGAWIVGTSEIGTATVRLLRMNLDERVEMRAELQAAGEM